MLLGKKSRDHVICMRLNAKKMDYHLETNTIRSSYGSYVSTWTKGGVKSPALSLLSRQKVVFNSLSLEKIERNEPKRRIGFSPAAHSNAQHQSDYNMRWSHFLSLESSLERSVR